MNNEETEIIYNLKEYAVEGLFNRNKIKDKDFGETLVGKSECYESMFNYSADVIKYLDNNHLIKNDYSISGYSGPVHCDRLIFDFDFMDDNGHPDIPKALEEAKVFINHLHAHYRIPLECISINLSGHKGFHIGIHTNHFGEIEPSVDTPQIIKSLVVLLSNGITNVDLKIYDKTRLIRLKNTVNKKSGLYAIPLTYEELNSLSADEILELAKSPREVIIIAKSTEIISELEQIKLAAIDQVRNSSGKIMLSMNNSVYKATHTTQASTSPYEIDLYSNIIRNCTIAQTINSKSKAGLKTNNTENLFVGSLLSKFGEEGKLYLHELLKDQENYDHDKTEYHFNQMNGKEYKPMLCESICGHSKCNKIRAIGKNSPIAFARFEGPFKEQIEFVESFCHYYKDQLFYSPKEKEFYFYVNGVFKRKPENELAIIISAYFNIFSSDGISDSRISGIIRRMGMYEGIALHEALNNNKYLINCENGVFDVKAGTFHSHSIYYKSTIQIRTKYDPSAKCPLFIKTLNEIFDNNEEKIDFLLQWFAYLLLPTYEYQKILILIGTGRNGKSLLIAVLSSILGMEYISNEKFSDLATDRGYNIVRLNNKLLNISSELSGSETDTDLLKKLSGGDYISAREIFKSRVNFINLARLVVLTNSMPRLSSIDYAMLKRFDIIEFTKSFADNPDTDLLTKLLKEKSGILNLILSKIPKILREDGSIKISSAINHEEIIDKYLPQFNSAAEWCKECTTFENLKDETLVNVSLTLLKDAYVHYKTWCTQSAGNKPVNKLKFKEILASVMKVKHAKIPYLSFDSSRTYKNENWFIGINITDENLSHKLKRVDLISRNII